MKRNTLIFIAVLLIHTTSCTKDFLDKEPLDQFGEEAVWSDLALMETFVNNIYYNIGHGFDGKIWMAMLCDEATRTSDRNARNIKQSLVTPSSFGAWTQRRQNKMRWDHIYLNVRACNLFLEQVEKHTFDDDEIKDRLTGEVHFLRAFHYHNLVFMYGGFPIITKVYTLTEDNQIARNTFEECINFIAEECDRAAALLPLSHEGSNIGRATRGAALALKSRVLLYAASDLYNNNAFPGYSDPELVSYSDQSAGARAARWQAAKDAAREVMDLNIYNLHKQVPAPGDDIAKNYQGIFLSKETTEDIFFRSFIQISMESSEAYHPGLHSSSNGYHGHGSNNPIQQLVDDFEMSDGSKFDWDNPVHSQDPYENREPRFYANILYNGASWGKRPVDVIAIDPVGIIQTGIYEQADGSWKGGLDTRSGPIAQEDGTATGYYVKKFLDPDVVAEFEVQEWPWRYIRYAEVLLNYAEACVELGEDAEARSYINMIRARAGISGVSTSGSELRESLRHERRIELMYEEQRFFDIRRWMIAPQVVSTPEIGVTIKYHLGQTKPTYEFMNVWNRVWKDQSYFMPIALTEMNKNKMLVQNPGY